MTLAQILASFREIDAAEAASLLGGVARDVPEDWRLMAVVLALALARRQRPGAAFALGLSGGQGAGKTTLARALVGVLGELGLNAASLSLDDFYLTRSERRELAQTVHPLLATRGVPGTHDVVLAHSVLSALKSRQEAACPVFDKSVDDRFPEPVILGPDLDVVIFEGWCVGVPAQPDEALSRPCNALEEEEDPAGSWRGYVNGCLERQYPALWTLLDGLLYLDVPDMAAVLRWRTEQEAALPASRRMSAHALQRFVAHYERLTRWMGRCMPELAQVVGFLDKNHCLARLEVTGFGR